MKKLISISSSALLLASGLFAPVQARYKSESGKYCDMMMERVEDWSLDKQFTFAKQCIQKIHKEANRYHDAYLMWIADIKADQEKYSEALDWNYWGMYVIPINNAKDYKFDKTMICKMTLWLQRIFKDCLYSAKCLNSQIQRIML